jgi:hypothetical protein
MCAAWNNKEYKPPAHLLAALDRTKDTDASGQLVFRGAGTTFEGCITVTQSSLIFSSRIPERERRIIITRSLFTAAQAGKLSVDSVLKEINKLEGAYLRLPLKKYALATGISIDYFSELKRAAIKLPR